MERVFSNAILVVFVKEMTVRHLVERRADIKQNDVYLVTCSKLVGNLVGRLQAGIRRSACVEPVLGNRERWLFQLMVLVQISDT